MRWLLAMVITLALPGLALAETPSPAATSATAEQPDAERLALARRLVTAGTGERTFVESAISGFLVAMRRGGATFTAAQETALRPALAAAFEAPAHVYVEELSAYVARSASLEDLVAGIAYYESETGQRYARVAVELVSALALFDISGEGSLLPDVPLESALTTRQRDLVDQLVDAFGPRIPPVEAERLETAGLDSAVLLRLMARFIVSRLDSADVEAAIAWARTPASVRLEGASAERAQAEQIALLRAIRAIDRDALRAAVDNVMRQNPT